MAEYRVQERPNWPGDGEGGDAIVFCSNWPADDYRRFKSWDEAWLWVAAELTPSDTAAVLTEDESFPPTPRGDRGSG